MRLLDAQQTADGVRATLAPFCERCEIAGSIRRECPEVRDVEIVCIPRARDVFGFAGIVNRWVRLKGSPTGRYTQRLHSSGVKLDIFMATEQNWGLILAIRTGSARFAHEVLAKGWCAEGYVSRGGMLHVRAVAGGPADDGPPIQIREEEELFRLIRVPWVEPRDRT